MKSSGPVAAISNRLICAGVWKQFLLLIRNLIAASRFGWRESDLRALPRQQCMRRIAPRNEPTTKTGNPMTTYDHEKRREREI